MSEVEVLPDHTRLRVCLVKQKSTYDLYTKETGDLRELVASSNWRTGPLGLWEAFDCEFRLLDDDGARECHIGETRWSKYVEGWKLYDDTVVYSKAEEIDWAAYDIVVSIDVAVPTRVIRAFPEVMWCYYFIEGGISGIDSTYRGSPYFGYNVFLTHRLGQKLLASDSRPVRQMVTERRAALDFPYYFLSSRTVQALYEPCQKSGACLGHQSRDVVTPHEAAALERLGPLRRDYPPAIASIHRLELESKYFILHPRAEVRAGTQVVEAVSAGCVVLGPPSRLWGYPALIAENRDQLEVEDILREYGRLEEDVDEYAKVRSVQAERVDQWCYQIPRRNLEHLYEAFRVSRPRRVRQQSAELRSSADRLMWNSRAQARRLLERFSPTTPGGHWRRHPCEPEP
jgi:hypothetical protein